MNETKPVCEALRFEGGGCLLQWLMSKILVKTGRFTSDDCEVGTAVPGPKTLFVQPCLSLGIQPKKRVVCFIFSVIAV